MHSHRHNEGSGLAIFTNPPQRGLEILVPALLGFHGNEVGQARVCDYFDSQVSGSESGGISIGRFCSIADDITITLYGDHNYKKITTSPLMPICGDYKQYFRPAKSENIVIGNDVWIGNGASILSNVSIGDGAVIGANTVIAKDIPPYAVVVGNPGKVIKFRFSEQQIKNLLAIAWWNWEHDKIKDNAGLLMADDIDAFIEAHLPAA